MSRVVWKIVEIKTEKIEMAKTKERGKERKRRKEMRRERIEEIKGKKKEKI